MLIATTVLTLDVVVNLRNRDDEGAGLCFRVVAEQFRHFVRVVSRARKLGRAALLALVVALPLSLAL